MRIIFDLDGTLVHSLPSLCAAANKMLRTYGEERSVPVIDYVQFVGHGMVRQVEAVLAHLELNEIPLAAAVAEFKRQYEADPLSYTTLYEDVTASLRTLSQAGHQLGVCTQKGQVAARAVLDGFALSPPVRALTAGDMLDVLKPDPRMIRDCAQQLGPADLSDVIYVGDSEVDAQTAEHAGVPFLLHGRGYAHGPLGRIRADAIFYSWDEVPALVAALSGDARE